VIAEPGWGIDPVYWEAGSLRCQYCGTWCRRYRPGSTIVDEEGCVKLRRRVHLVATMTITSQADLDLIEERVHDEGWWRRHEDPNYHEEES
jgi:hypothetical protein